VPQLRRGPDADPRRAHEYGIASIPSEFVSRRCDRHRRLRGLGFEAQTQPIEPGMLSRATADGARRSRARRRRRRSIRALVARCGQPDSRHRTARERASVGPASDSGHSRRPFPPARISAIRSGARDGLPPFIATGPLIREDAHARRRRRERPHDADRANPVGVTVKARFAAHRARRHEPRRHASANTPGSTSPDAVVTRHAVVDGCATDVGTQDDTTDHLETSATCARGNRTPVTTSVAWRNRLATSAAHGRATVRAGHALAHGRTWAAGRAPPEFPPVARKTAELVHASVRGRRRVRRSRCYPSACASAMDG